MKRNTFAALAAASILAFTAMPALAQLVTETAPGTVTIPWGDWITALQTILVTAIMGAITWILAMLPASIRTFFQTQQVEQVLRRAVDYGVNAVAGAAKGKKLDVKVGNEVLAAALQYAIDNAPKLVAKLGESNIAEKIIARLDLDEKATVTDGEIRPAT